MAAPGVAAAGSCCPLASCVRCPPACFLPRCCSGGAGPEGWRARLILAGRCAFCRCRRHAGSACQAACSQERDVSCGKCHDEAAMSTFMHVQPVEAYAECSPAKGTTTSTAATAALAQWLCAAGCTSKPSCWLYSRFCCCCHLQVLIRLSRLFHAPPDRAERLYSKVGMALGSSTSPSATVTALVRGRRLLGKPSWPHSCRSAYM